MIGKLGFSTIYTSPIIFLAWLTVYANDKLSNPTITILLASATILVTFVFAQKVGDIWNKNKKDK
jgi:hypothetical protein